MTTPPPLIEEWTDEHPRWQELVDAVTAEGQAGWACNPFFAPFPRHILVAERAGTVAGFLIVRGVGDRPA